MSTSVPDLLDTFDRLSPTEKRKAASAIIRRAFALDRHEINDARLAALYAQYHDDDRRLADEGIQDYEKGLVGEDDQ